MHDRQSPINLIYLFMLYSTSKSIGQLVLHKVHYKAEPKPAAIRFTLKCLQESIEW